MVYLESRTCFIIVGLLCELFGGIFLAFEMIELLDKIKKWNLSLHDKIQAKKKEFALDIASISLSLVLFYFILDHVKTYSLKELFFLIHSISILYIFIILNSVSLELLDFSEYLSEKLCTKRVIGLLGVVLLCLGFIIQFYINLTTK